MCTVTFIPGKDRYFITSNRDEKSYRKHAVAPLHYPSGDYTLLYPRDADAGGSWIAMHSNGNATVLLNGAFKKHSTKPTYRVSRGLIFLEIIQNAMPVKYFLQLNLENIEPFTLIIWDEHNLYECRWDSKQKQYCQLLKNKTHIWSSSTLYDVITVEKRENWFAKWLKKTAKPGQKDILNFHRFGGEGNTQNDLLMNRDGKVLTVSITGMELTCKKGIMTYLDLKTNTEHISEMNFTTDYTVA